MIRTARGLRIRDLRRGPRCSLAERTRTTRSALCSTTSCLHQTVIGLEAKEHAGPVRRADSRHRDRLVRWRINLGGISLPFVPDAGVDLLAVEPSSCPTLTEGTFRYDFADVAKMTPLLPMYTLGHELHAPSTYTPGGLRLSRRRADHLHLVRPSECGQSLSPRQGVRGGRSVRPHPGNDPCTRDRTCHPRRDGRGTCPPNKPARRSVILFSYSGHGLVGPRRIRRLPARASRPGLAGQLRQRCPAERAGGRASFHGMRELRTDKVAIPTRSPAARRGRDVLCPDRLASPTPLALPRVHKAPTTTTTNPSTLHQPTDTKPMTILRRR